MRRLLLQAVAVVAVGLLAVAAFVVPDQAAVVADPPAPPAPPAYAVCPMTEAAQRQSIISLVGGDGGDAGVSMFSGGEIVVDEEIAGASPAASISVNELTGLARAPTLVRLPAPDTLVATSLEGGGLAASVCGPSPTGTVILPGGATTQGESVSLVLANPFAGTATVNVGVSSEVGTESEPGLTGIIVPPRSEVALDIASMLPGRQTIAVSITPVLGRVVGASVQAGGGDVAAVSGMEPGSDWFLPVPGIEGARRSIVVATAGTAEVPFQLDLYDAEGLFEAAYEDTVPARGQVTVDVADLFEGPGAVRVVAAGPVAASLRLDGEGIRTIVPGVAGGGSSWILPGAGVLGATDVYLFNPGEIEVQADVVSGDGSNVVATVAVPGASTVVVPVSTRHGARVEGDGDLVVTWITAGEAGVAGDAGVLVGP